MCTNYYRQFIVELKSSCVCYVSAVSVLYYYY